VALWAENGRPFQGSGGLGGGDFSAGGRHGRDEDGCQAPEQKQEKRRCTAAGEAAVTYARRNNEATR